MSHIEQVTESLFKAIDQLNRELPQRQKLPKKADTVLFGESGALDSMGLVSLVIAAEQQIARDFGCAITLADERAMSRHRSPFRTVASLADYVAALLREKSQLNLQAAS